MSVQLKEKEIKETFETFAIGYCEAPCLFGGYFNSHFFTAGVYGWKSDIYILQSSEGLRNIAISTGYNPIGKRIDRKTCAKMENYACKLNRSKYPYSKRVHMVQKYVWKTLKDSGYIK